MSKIDMYNGQAANIADKIEQKVSDLMITVKKHPSMRRYSPHVRKGVQQEIKALLNNRISNYSLKISDDDINQWLNEYTPYAQASTTAYIQRVAKEKGFKTLTPEQVAYVKDALLNSMEPDEYFDWSKGEGVKIPLHGKALGTERDLAAKVATHVEWSVKKTVGNALKPENVIEFLVKNKKSLGLDSLDDENIVDYVDNIISVASMSLREARGSNGKKITERSIQNIDNALLNAAFTANVKMSDFSGALLRKIGTSTFVDNDTRLGEIKKEFDNKIGDKARKNQDDVQNYARLKALMNRFFTALRWSMHYKTGKMGTSTYTAANQYMKIELAIMEFVANTNLSMAELVRRFESIFASNDNPEAVERLYMTEVLNAWWVNVSSTLGIDEDISLEIQSDIIAEETGAYIAGNAGRFERDIDREKAIQATLKKIENAIHNGVPDKAKENAEEIARLVRKYMKAKVKAGTNRKKEAEIKRKNRAKDKKEDKPEVRQDKEIKKRIAKEKRDAKQALQDKLLNIFEAKYMKDEEKLVVDTKEIKVLDRETLMQLKYTLFGTHKELTKGDLSKFLSAAYRLSGANDKDTRDIFILKHFDLLNDVIKDENLEEILANKHKKLLDKIQDTAIAEKKKADEKRIDETMKQIKKAVSSTFGKENSKEKKADEKRIDETMKQIKKAVLSNFGKEKSEKTSTFDKEKSEEKKVDKKAENQAKKEREAKEKAAKEAAEKAQRATEMTNSTAVYNSDLMRDITQISRSTERYLQQTTSRLKIDVIRKIDNETMTKKLITYRASKNERHKALVKSSIDDFITKSTDVLGVWEQNSKAEADKIFAGKPRERTRALAAIDKDKKRIQATIRDEARKMKNKALEKFHDAIYS